MKNLITAALLVITASASAFAPDPGKISYSVLRNFEIEFSQATDVVWTPRRDFVKATFTLCDKKMEAIFDLDGEMIAKCKNISLDDLPVNAKRNFARRFDGYTVKEAIRFDGNEEGAYFISAENEKENVIVKVNDSEQVSIFKKTRK